MKSPRETRTLYASRERRSSNLTQCFVHGIVPKAFTGWALILMLMTIFLIARESLTGRSSGSSPICSIICLLGGQLGISWWVPSPCATQLFLQFINFTLHVPFTLCMGDVALPSWLTLTGMRGMHASFMISPLLRVCNQIFMLRAPRFCLVQLASSWCGLIVGWCEPNSSISNAKPESPSDQIKFFPQKAPIVRTSFGLDPKQDWALVQQAQTINL